MKYLLILLFLFSTHSFSGEADGKGIECWPKGVDKKIKDGFMYWFNNDRVILVYTSEKKERIPPSEILSSHGKNVWSSHTYASNANYIIWYETKYFKNYLDRKTLIREIKNTMDETPPGLRQYPKRVHEKYSSAKWYDWKKDSNNSMLQSRNRFEVDLNKCKH